MTVKCRINVSVWAGALSAAISRGSAPLVVGACRRGNTRLTAVIGGLVLALASLFTSFAVQTHQVLLRCVTAQMPQLSTARMTWSKSYRAPLKIIDDWRADFFANFHTSDFWSRGGCCIKNNRKADEGFFLLTFMREMKLLITCWINWSGENKWLFTCLLWL